MNTIKSALDIKALAGLAIGIFLYQKFKNRFSILQ